MPSTSESRLDSLPQNDSFKKYTFPSIKFIICFILINAISFMILSFTFGTMFWQFSSNHSFNKEFYDSCQVKNAISLKDLFMLRTEIYDDELVIKELHHVDLNKVRDHLKTAIEEEIEYKTTNLNDTIEKCEFQEFYRKSCYSRKIKKFVKNQTNSINLVFKIYVPCSLVLLLVIFAAFWKAKISCEKEDQKKSYKFLAIIFASHVFVHVLMLYNMVYDNSNNFKPKEIPSICTKEDPYLTEDCYFSGTNCLEMCELPKMLNGPTLTIINYLLWQVLFCIVGFVLMVFGEGRYTIKDGYEEV